MTEPTAGKSIVEQINRFNRDRKPRLVRLKFRRMSANAFAFFRGTDHLFVGAWSELGPADVGPEIRISGDLHLENFGAYRTDGGEFLFDINDFDEAAVAPCSIDLVRCTTSILLAAQLWKLTPVQAMRTVLAFLERYREAVLDAARTGQTGQESLQTGRGPIHALLGRTAFGNQVEFLDRHTKVGKGGHRKIRRGDEDFPGVGAKRAALIRDAVEGYGQRAGIPEFYRVVDVSYRIAGIGSLGVRRYVALIEGEGSHDRNRLLDIKEARPSVLLGLSGQPEAGTGTDEAERVVRAQRALQAKPAARLDVLHVGRLACRMRELVPAENRSSLDRLKRRPSRLRRAVEVAGRLAGWSQVRGSRCDGVDRLAELERWAAGPSLDGVLAAAVRFADQTRHDYKVFRATYRAGDLDAKLVP